MKAHRNAYGERMTEAEEQQLDSRFGSSYRFATQLSEAVTIQQGIVATFGIFKCSCHATYYIAVPLFCSNIKADFLAQRNLVHAKVMFALAATQN